MGTENIMGRAVGSPATHLPGQNNGEIPANELPGYSVNFIESGPYPFGLPRTKDVIARSGTPRRSNLTTCFFVAVGAQRSTSGSLAQEGEACSEIATPGGVPPGSQLHIEGIFHWKNMQCLLLLTTIQSLLCYPSWAEVSSAQGGNL